MKILGFDLGDGESAVTFFDGESTVEPRVMLLGGQMSMLSAVATREGRIVVGEEASVLAGASEAQVRFKSRYLTDSDAPRAIRAFAQGVMAMIMREEPALMAEVSRTVVGCPAGWGQLRRDQYAALIESAGFPNVHVVPEPRSAFLYARHARGLRIDAALLQKSAMVIDIGSSTTDFAYIVDGRQQNLTSFGDNSLGGGVLDELILNRAIQMSPDRKPLERVMKESGAWRSYCELEARRLKEKYFTSEEKWQTAPLTKPLTVCYDETLMLDIRLDGAAMEEIVNTPTAALGGRSFMTCLSDALQAAVLASSACPPQVVILTGGASRMAFFRDACARAFEGSVMVMCPEPECSIARGLAYAGRVDEHLTVFRQEIASIARGDKLLSLVSGRVHELYTPVSKALYEAVREEAIKAVRLWKRGGVKTIDALDEVLQKNIEKAFAGEAVKARIEGDLRVWLDALMRQLEGELLALCMRCGVPPERMSLGAAQLDAGLGGVNISLLDAMGMDILSGLMGVVLAVVGASICGGGGMAIVGTGPMGIVVGVVAGVLLTLLGKNSVEKMIRQMELPILMRQLVTDTAVLHGMNRQREEIERAIVSALADPRNGFSARLCQSLSGTLGVQLESMARGAEMSICA